MSAAADAPDLGALVLVAGDERRAVTPHAACELVRYVQPTPLPGAPPELLGLANVRGEVLAVLDLARVLGVREAAGALRFLVVVEADGARFALAVGDAQAAAPAPDLPPTLDVDAVALRFFEPSSRAASSPAGIG